MKGRSEGRRSTWRLKQALPDYERGRQATHINVRQKFPDFLAARMQSDEFPLRNITHIFSSSPNEMR